MKRRRILATVLAFALALPTCSLPAAAAAQPELINTVEGEFVFGSNLLAVKDETGYGLMTVDGTMVADTVYKNNFDCSYGLISVSRQEGDHSRMGVIRSDGTAAVPFEYNSIRLLPYGWILALKLVPGTEDDHDIAVGDNEEYYRYQTVSVYHCAPDSLGLCECLATLTRDQFQDFDVYGNRINIQDRATGTITTYDQDFHVVAADRPNLTSYSLPLYAGHPLVVGGDNGELLIDSDGNAISASYSKVYTPLRGYAMVMDENGLFGLIDDTGAEILPVQYEEIYYSASFPMDNDGPYDTQGYFVNGYLGVEYEGRFGFVDKSGNFTSPTIPSDQLRFCNGASAFYQDETGTPRILAADGVAFAQPSGFSFYSFHFTNGYYYAKIDGDTNKLGIMDWHGDTLLPCSYASILFSGDGRYAAATRDDGMTEIYRMPEHTDFAGNGSSSAPQPVQPEDAAGSGGDDVLELETEIAGGASGSDDVLELETEVAGGASGGDDVLELETEAAGGASGGGSAQETETDAALPPDISSDTDSEALPGLSENADSPETTAAIAILDSAIRLLGDFSGANNTSALALIKSAASLLSNNAPVSALLDSAATLLSDGSTGNDIALSLVTSARVLLAPSRNAGLSTAQ